MKAQLIAATIAAAAVLSACSKHEGVHAVDKLKEAEAAALAKAPKAEEVKFDDHGQPTFAETSGAADAAANATPAADAATAQPVTDAAAATQTTTEAQATTTNP
ncbi:hypothetical protein LU290_07725 [Moraxella nasibovis]|uniref:hypothetical protein n=1 Tax=Moraxella nasibovis TaxID=2904120 RepID=UPI00240ECF3F|nr:hypothetical protein [Moraxella nasibovis]WFF38143.1 hypothetical protein LU290_07725 [Moraxella nasibovis]